MKTTLPYCLYLEVFDSCMTSEQQQHQQQQQHVMLTAGASYCRKRVYSTETNRPASSGSSSSYPFCKVFLFDASLLLQIHRL